MYACARGVSFEISVAKIINSCKTQMFLRLSLVGSAEKTIFAIAKTTLCTFLN
jgi:hypothetical protein